MKTKTFDFGAARPSSSRRFRFLGFIFIHNFRWFCSQKQVVQSCVKDHQRGTRPQKREAESSQLSKWPRPLRAAVRSSFLKGLIYSKVGPLNTTLRHERASFHCQEPTPAEVWRRFYALKLTGVNDACHIYIIPSGIHFNCLLPPLLYKLKTFAFQQQSNLQPNTMKATL